MMIPQWARKALRILLFIWVLFWPVYIPAGLLFLMFKYQFFLKKILKVLLFTNESICSAVKIQTIILSSRKKRAGASQIGILEKPNDVIDFPIPKYFTDPSHSELHIISLLRSLTAVFRTADHEMARKIQLGNDTCVQTIKVMGTEDRISHVEIEQYRRIHQSYSKDGYNLTQEIFFGDLNVNGQNPYLLRDYNMRKNYSFQKSLGIQRSYQNAIENAFHANELNLANMAIVGLSEKGIKERIAKGQNLLVAFLEDMENITQGGTICHIKTILFDDEDLALNVYLQTPYAVFGQIKVNDAKSYICFAIAFRYRQDPNAIKVFSPFFQAQPEPVWRLAKSQAIQTIFGDFSVRVHLSVLHLTTSQYLLPISNYRKITRNGNLETFLHYGFDIFNKGLEGINVSATSVLVNPIETYSLINDSFAINAKEAIQLLKYSNKVDMNSFNPESLVRQHELAALSEDKESLVYLDLTLNKILSKYIADLYKYFNIAALQNDLLNQINSENINMKVFGEGPRPMIEDHGLLQLLQNLCFSWVVYHSHTFSNSSHILELRFKCGFLSQELKDDPREWGKIDERQYIPHTKIKMEICKLGQGTTLKDDQNFILDVLERKKVEAERSAEEAVVRICNQAISGLRTFSEYVYTVNEKRSKKNQLRLYWMNPVQMQASLNR